MLARALRAEAMDRVPRMAQSSPRARANEALINSRVRSCWTLSAEMTPMTASRSTLAAETAWTRFLAETTASSSAAMPGPVVSVTEALTLDAARTEEALAAAGEGSSEVASAT